MARKTIKKCEEKIANLEKQLDVLMAQVNEARNEYFDFKKDINNALYLHPSTRSPGNRGNASQHSPDEILQRAHELSITVAKEGEILPLIDHAIKAENAKLWYLVRVAMDDKQVTEPRNILSDTSKFNRPNFNE